MKKLITRSITAAALLPVLWIAPTMAAPVTWTLDATLDSGDTWAGTFDYDADNQQLSNIMIETSLSDPDLGDSPTYTFGNVVQEPARLQPAIDTFVFGTQDLSDNTGGFAMRWQAESPLTNAGGTLALTPGMPYGEAACLDAGCGVFNTVALVSSGFVTTVPSAVPVPAAAWLFGSALLGLGAIKRRKA